MQTVYNSDKFEVRQYGTELTYLLLDHASGEWVVFEPPQSHALLEALQDGEDTNMTDIYLGGVMALANQFSKVKGAE